jgi:hypothetical protein
LTREKEMNDVQWVYQTSQMWDHMQGRLSRCGALVLFDRFLSLERLLHWWRGRNILGSIGR